MIEPVADTLSVLGRASLVGAFGGVALIVAHLYSRRGAIIYPVYAGILLVAALMLSQFDSTSYALRFSAVLLSLMVATFMAIVHVTMHSARVLKRRAQQGKPVPPGSAPWWGMPVVAGGLLAVSAGAALVLK